ncbi:YcxB family protein [Streptomyces caeni]|uniref:YcxB family protein n=1 Tax=Streptomyces caeni TaxID=2307231 RepID=A0ABW4IIC5_9ACTN
MVERTVEQHETDVVLEYEYRQEEMTDALRVMLRRQGRAGILHRPVVLVGFALFGVALLVGGVRGDDATLVSFGVMLALWPVLMSRVPQKMARRLIGANQHHGVMRVTVGEQGVRTVSAHVDARMGWANYGTYAETDRCFLLRSPDRGGTCAVVLVKRGARSPEDVDRLRALLDRQLPRA